MPTSPIYVTQPFLPPLEEFQPYLEDIWKRRWLTNNGKYHQELEAALADYLGVDHISLFSNGTLALITALQALDIKGEVITTPFSFVATTHSLWWNNIRPVFGDIEPRYFNLDPAGIEALITPETSAIMPVHVYGNPCDVKAIKDVADKHGLKVIYDACHTFGVKLDGQSVLKWGDLAVMSFHATKVYNTFEGGAIVSPTAEMKQRIDFLKNFGFADEVTVVGPGINAKMNEFQSAVGLLQLKYIDENILKRKAVAETYLDLLKGIDGLRLPVYDARVSGCYSYFPVLIDSERYGVTRDLIYDRMMEKNIFTRRYFYPLISHFEPYNGLDSARPHCLPVAERLSGQVLCLPIYPELDIDTVKYISELLLQLKV